MDIGVSEGNIDGIGGFFSLLAFQIYILCTGIISIKDMSYGKRRFPSRKWN